MRLAYLTAGAALRCQEAHSADVVEVARCNEFVAASRARWTAAEGSLMTRLENRCASCGGKLGLISHHHWGLRFCRKACKDNFLARTAKDHACMRRWFGFLPRKAS
jgi:ribosomal protein S14